MEPTMPIDTLKRMRFGLSCLVELHKAGSYEREQVRLMTEGLRRELDWVIANLEKAGEGKKNFGLDKF